MSCTKAGIAYLTKKRGNTQNDIYTHISVYHIHDTDKHENVKWVISTMKKITDFTTNYFEIAKQTEFVNGQDERAAPAVDKCHLFRFVADKAVKHRRAQPPIWNYLDLLLQMSEKSLAISSTLAPSLKATEDDESFFRTYSLASCRIFIIWE